MNLAKKTWRIGRVGGTEIHLHISMLLVIPLIYFVFRPRVWEDVLIDSVWALGLFASILLHELGHALVAQAFQIQVKKIVLWPLGGITQLSAESKKPWQRFAISAAGPAVSLGLAGAFWAAHIFSTVPIEWYLMENLWKLQLHSLLTVLALTNGILAVFNLLPIFPLDGGGMLHALGEGLFGKRTANVISLVVGLPVLIGLVVFSLVQRDYLLLLFCFLMALGLASLNPHSQRWLTLAVNYLFRRSGYHYLQEDFDASIQMYTQKLAAQPQDVNSRLARSLAYTNLGEIAQAKADVEQVLQMDPQNAVALELRGEMFAMDKDYPTALEHYQQVKALKPDWGVPYLDAGGAHLEQGDPAAALGELDQAVALMPEFPLGYLVRSMAHYHLGDRAAAHRDQAEALKISPQQALTVNEVNLSLYRNELDWALDFFGWVLEKYPKQWMAYQGRGDALAVNGQEEQALEDYTQAIQLAPRQPVLYLRRGAAYQRLGRVEEARQDFQQVLALKAKSHLRRRAEALLGEEPMN